MLHECLYSHGHLDHRHTEPGHGKFGLGQASENKSCCTSLARLPCTPAKLCSYSPLPAEAGLRILKVNCLSYMPQSDCTEWGNHFTALQISHKGWAYIGPLCLDLCFSSLLPLYFQGGDWMVDLLRFSDSYRPTESHLKNTTSNFSCIGLPWRVCENPDS